jgi:hypothetical protein
MTHLRCFNCFTRPLSTFTDEISDMDTILVPVPVPVLQGSLSIDPTNKGVRRDAPLPDNSALQKSGDYVYRGSTTLCHWQD